MRFIGVHPGYSMTFNGGTRRAITHPSGTTEFIDNGDFFSIDFKPGAGHLTTQEIETAKQLLYAGPQGRFVFGSHPSSEEGNINVLDARVEGYAQTAHQGYDPYQQLSYYDTKDPKMCPPEKRDEIEAFLLNHHEASRAYVRVDLAVLTPPWPSYPEEGATYDAKKVAAFAAAGGMLDIALSYEEATTERPDLIAAYAVAKEAAEKRAAEEAGLSARVG